jgi:hypothetical protein
MVEMETGEEASQAVSFTRFPPDGVRGLAAASRSSRFGRIKDYHRRAHAEICVLVQVESALGLENLEAICAVPGVDGVFVGGRGKIKHREFAFASGEMSPFQFVAFLKKWIGLAAQFSEDGSIHYICIDWRHLTEILAAGEDTYTELKNVVVWAKTNAGQGSSYRSQHEFIFVFKNGDALHLNNIELGRLGRN